MTKDLTLSAGMKYNERDNKTASNTYNFIDLGGKNRTAVNTPMSNRKTQVELAGDYRINQDNRVRLAYEYEKVERWCNNALANNAHGVVPTGYTYTTNSCVQIPETNENKLAASYKLKLNEALNLNAGYSYAKRNANVNATFYNPMQALTDGFENYGYRAFFDAGRNEQQIKLGANLQPTEKLSFGISGRYLYDQYNDSPLGVQNGDAFVANFDASYNYSDSSVLAAFASFQKRQRDLLSGNGRTPATVNTALWTNQLHDHDTTLGLSANQKGFWANKLDFAEALTYSMGSTVYNTQVPYSVGQACALANSTTALTCGSTPDIRNTTLSIGLNGSYHVDKASKVSLAYLYQRLHSNDYYYNAYQDGYTGTGYLPTNEQSPSYSVSVVTATYTYDF
jgi:MtrB/PioB family decaheme-associated outer membrane protein